MAFFAHSPASSSAAHALGALIAALMMLILGAASVQAATTDAVRASRLAAATTMEDTRKSRTQAAKAAAPRKLTWRAPMTREDGSSLYPGEIQGYRIYVKAGDRGRVRTIPIDDATSTSLSLDRFAPGVYQFSISTVDTNGLESRRSVTIRVSIS